jgi:ribonuclease R/exosome complex exonuclease DIS3/RRP44
VHKKPTKKVKGIIKVTSKPMGFVMPDGVKSNNDIVVFEENLNCALDRDEVEVEIVGRDRDRSKGKITKILKRNKTEFVGVLEKVGQSFVFLPDDWKFYRKVEIRVIPEEVQDGDKALVKIKDWSNPTLNPVGEILKVIGQKARSS